MAGSVHEADGPLVSILVPSYNHERFVAQTIESVCGQRYRPLELVVIDDGSTDRTVETIARGADVTRRRLDGFVFEQQANAGIPRTLNRGLRHARGAFIVVLGSDDVCLPNQVESLISAPEWADPRTAVVFGDACFIDEHGNRVGVLEDQSTAPIGSPGAESQALAHYLRWRTAPEPGRLGSYATLLRGMFIPMLTALIRRSALDAAGGFDERYFLEDYPLLLKLARDQRIVAIPDVVAERRLHGDNASLVRKGAVFREFLELMVRERAYARSDPIAAAERAASRDRAYLGVREHGTRSDLLRILARHPVAAPGDLLASHRRVR